MRRTLEDTLSMLMLAATGLHSQRRNHYLAEALSRVTRGRMKPRDISLLRTTMDYDEVIADEKEALAQKVKSH